MLLSEPGLEVAERALGLLGEAGFNIEQAAEIGDYLIGAIVTLVTAEPGRSRSDEAIRQQRARLGALSPEQFPHVGTAAAERAQRVPRRRRVLLGGLTRSLPGAQGSTENHT